MHYLQTGAEILFRETDVATSARRSSLVWVDMEMTGLSPERDYIIEIAIIVTDSMLETIAQAPVLALYQPESVLSGMDTWNQTIHKKTGLLERVRASTYREAEVEEMQLDFLKKYVDENCSPMCGNTICQDRRFMVRHMPALEAFFHYRNLDVSTLKELMKRWRADLQKKMAKASRHEALADIQESIEELRFYREHFLNCQVPL